MSDRLSKTFYENAFVVGALCVTFAGLFASFIGSTIASHSASALLYAWCNAGFFFFTLFLLLLLIAGMAVSAWEGRIRMNNAYNPAVVLGVFIILACVLFCGMQVSAFASDMFFPGPVSRTVIIDKIEKVYMGPRGGSMYFVYVDGKEEEIRATTGMMRATFGKDPGAVTGLARRIVYLPRTNLLLSVD